MRLILFFFLFTTGVAQAASLLLDKTIAGFASPESVVVAGNDVFVSNLGEKLEPMQKDGDGFISRLDRHGNVKTLKWAADLHGPKGMIAVGGVLYVADIDRVVGFRIGDGKRVFELDLAATGARFLNAFARIDEHRLLLSATDLGKVFVIDVKARKFSELAFDIPPKGPNGMKLAGSQLIVVEWGSDSQANGGIKTYRLQGLSAKRDKQFDPSPAGYFDGVVNMGANRWLLSNWVAFEPVGQLQVLDSASGQVTSLRAPVPLAGPADIFLDDQGKLWVPGMMEGKVHRMTLRR
jgi:DNA-binding beta-propeller fold protein YncE